MEHGATRLFLGALGYGTCSDSKAKKCCRNIPKNFVVTDKGKSGLISASERREDGL